MNVYIIYVIIISIYTCGTMTMSSSHMSTHMPHTKNSLLSMRATRSLLTARAPRVRSGRLRRALRLLSCCVFCGGDSTRIAPLLDLL